MVQVASHLFVGPKVTDFSKLKEKRIERLISVQTDKEDMVGGFKYEYHAHNEHGVERIYFCVPSHCPPNADVVNRVLGMMVDPTVTQYLQFKDQPFIAGYLVAIYRMLAQHWSFVDAHGEWVTKSKRPLNLWWWRFNLKSWSKKA